MVRLVATEKKFEIGLRFFLENVAVRGPSTTRELKPMDSVSLSSNDSLGMEECSVFIPKLDPLLSRFLVPKHFFLEEDVVIFLL